MHNPGKLFMLQCFYFQRLISQSCGITRNRLISQLFVCQQFATHRLVGYYFHFYLNVCQTRFSKHQCDIWRKYQSESWVWLYSTQPVTLFRLQNQYCFVKANNWLHQQSDCVCRNVKYVLDNVIKNILMMKSKKYLFLHSKNCCG